MKELLELYNKKIKKINKLPQNSQKSLEEKLIERVFTISNKVDFYYKNRVKEFNQNFSKIDKNNVIVKDFLEKKVEKRDEQKRKSNDKYHEKLEDKKVFRLFLDEIKGKSYNSQKLELIHKIIIEKDLDEISTLTKIWDLINLYIKNVFQNKIEIEEFVQSIKDDITIHKICTEKNRVLLN